VLIICIATYRDLFQTHNLSYFLED